MSRIRKFNMTKLTNKQADELGDQIGDLIRQKVDETVNELNAQLKKYGIRTRMQIAIEPITKEVKEL